MIEITDIAIKLVTGFVALFILIKWLGAKIIDQITPFTFIAAIVLSELLGNAVYDKNVGLLPILFSIMVWGSLLFIVEFSGWKNFSLRSAFEGKPSMVIREGKLDINALKKSRMNITQLQSLLRQSEVFSIREVAYAYIEPNGSISILKKSQYQKTTQEDFQMPPQPVYVPITIIRDGELRREDLAEIEKNEQWLHSELRANGLHKIDDVLLAEWVADDGLFVIPYH
ncbi:DUF421 domain-containing protein [Alteribacillus sp. HJP-4]|uniref:DUF421 domain-containing protein n=1 Tax=Alteribacillus sp. HJP-4 TaxID=2775394 RepID=UPI0035CD238B